MMWRPIETAPKDGTKILLLCDWEPVTVVGYWGTAPSPVPDSLSEGDDPNEAKWRVQWDQHEFESGYEATHWMPLPDPPESA